MEYARLTDDLHVRALFDGDAREARSRLRQPASQSAYGEQWHHQKRSLLLFVPSVVARLERNILINPDHPEFGRIAMPTLHTPVWWDARLFSDTGGGAATTGKP
jgi:RES domain-containing protein